VLCTIDELDGYMYSMSAYLHPQDGPSPICPGAFQSQTNNPTWFAFVAWCTNLTLRVSASNCTQVQNAIGFQLAIYEDCTFNHVIACNADIQDCTTNAKILNITGLNIGGVYYFMVDGCLGSYCDVTIDIIGVCGQEVIAPWTLPVMGELFPCEGDSETYVVEDLDGAGTYHWFLDGLLIGQTATGNFNIHWTTPGTYQLCIDASNDPCVPVTDPPLPLCATIIVNEVDAGVLNISPSLLCPSETASISTSGYVTGTDNNQILLITDALGLIIEIINAPAGTFNSPAGGTFIVYAYNYSTNGGTVPVIGSNINDIDCSSKCCDLESQTIIFQGIQAGVSNIVCNDNGTGDDSSDDTFTFDVLVTGQNVGTLWNSTDGSLQGMYGTPLVCGPYSIISGVQNFDLHDYDVPTCFTSISVSPPLPCSFCNQTIDAGAGGILNCMNTSITLFGASSEPGLYQWSGPNLFSSNTLIATVHDSGWYYFSTLFPNHCADIDSVFVGLDHDVPIANAGADQLIDCNHQEVVIDGTTSSGNNLQYEWKDENGVVISTKSIFPWASSGTYFLKLTNTINGCTSLDTVEVFLHPNALGVVILNITPENCQGDNNGVIEVSGIEGGIPPYSYILNGIGADSSGQFINLSPGGYNIEVTDGYGCRLDTFVTVDPGVHLEINLPEIIELVQEQSGIIQAFINVPTSDLNSIYWTPRGILSCDTCLRSTISTAINQTLQLTVVHINGCVATAELNIVVVPAPHIYIPNTFTPNGDGLNDFFMLYSNDRIESILQLSIFDRWGDHIFEGQNLNPNEAETGWDGTFKGKEMNPGIFVYFIKVLMKDGTTMTKYGDITMLK
jgi:gliding motility-associated-like protein